MDGPDAALEEAGTGVEAGLDDADGGERALIRAVLQALRCWRIEGRAIVVTRDGDPHEVRIDAFEAAAPLSRTELGEPPSTCAPPSPAWLAVDENGIAGARRCPGRGPSIVRGRELGRRRR